MKMTSSYCAGYLEKIGCFTRHNVNRKNGHSNFYVHFKIVEKEGKLLKRILNYLEKIYDISYSFYSRTNTYEINDMKSIFLFIVFLMNNCERRDFLLEKNYNLLLAHIEKQDTTKNKVYLRKFNELYESQEKNMVL